MIMRLSLLTVEESVERARLMLFVPVRLGDSTEFGMAITYDPNSLPGEWPSIHGNWSSKLVFGTVEYDGNENRTKIQWSDGDFTVVDLEDAMALMNNRLLTFSSVPHRTVTTFRILDIYPP